MGAITHGDRDETRMSRMAGFSRPAVLLRVEGAALFAMSVLLYWVSGGSWLMFALLLLAPDLSMLGYIGGPRYTTSSTRTRCLLRWVLSVCWEEVR